MSDAIKHECGIALLRLKKPLTFYQEKYGTAFYGINKLYLLMEKQRNRGQDGAGIANIKLDVIPGERYISRKRSIGDKPIKEIFDYVNRRFAEAQKKNPKKFNNVNWLKRNIPFTGELFLGHLRYGTYGKNRLENCHPFLRQNNWMTRNLVVAGNFNLTNVDELFNILIDIGQHPKEKSDTVTVLEKIGHFLDEENERLYQEFKNQGHKSKDISPMIAESLNLRNILENSALDWDGGYVMAGMLGHGDAFVIRDPNGIRPAYFYEDDEIVVVTSERPVIQTAFDVDKDAIHELPAGNAITIKKNGSVELFEVKTPGIKKSCSFERIYFSRGNDYDIYKERQMLGRTLVPKILDVVNKDLSNAVFSFIPNTAEVSFYGLIKGLEEHLNSIKAEQLKKIDLSDKKAVQELLNKSPRIEKIAIKDAKLRTFITRDDDRDDMVAHVYDVTYGTVNPGIDDLVVIDDSIVRGTTLKQSILKILDRLNPKSIVVVSSAPQIRYPDCYGIDMAKLGDFIAFQAAIALLKENGMQYLIDEIFNKCEAQLNKPKEEIENFVKEIYAPFTAEEISRKIGELLTPKGISADVKIIYQSIEGLHKACPNNLGDWYFTGDYPTPGGNKVVNRAFVNYYKGVNKRAY